LTNLVNEGDTTFRDFVKVQPVRLYRIRHTQINYRVLKVHYEYEFPIARMEFATMGLFSRQNRVSLIKVDCGYDSAIIDPYGRIIARDVSPEPNVTMLIADVPMGTANALQTRLGDWIGWLALAGMIFFTIFDAVTARQQKEA